MQLNPILAAAGQQPQTILDLIREDRNKKLQDQINSQKVETNAQNLEFSKQKRLEDAVRKKFDLLSDREKMREKSLLQGALEIKPLLDNGDINATVEMLQSRQDRLASLGIDSSDTERVIAQLKKGDVGGVKRAVNSQIRAFDLLTGRTRNLPASIQFVNELQSARASGDTQRVQDLLQAQKIQTIPRGMQVNPNTGNVENIGGVTQSLQDQSYSTEKGKQTANESIRRDLGLDNLRKEENLKADVKKSTQKDLREQVEYSKYPEIEKSVDEAIEDIDDLLADPAIDSVIGAIDARTPNLYPGARRVQNLIDRIKTQSVLKASQALSGTLSDADLELLGRAENNLDQSLNEQDFRNNVKKLRRRLIDNLSVAKKKAGIKGERSLQKQRLRFNPNTGDFE